MIRLILTIMLSALAFVSMGANDCAKSDQADINDNATGLSMPLAMQSQEVGFTYDALGRRLSKAFGTTVTRWVWNGNVPLYQWRQRREYSVMKNAGFERGNIPSNYLNTYLSGETSWKANPSLRAEATGLADKLKADFDADVERRKRNSY